jgi:hypothetical protein
LVSERSPSKTWIRTVGWLSAAVEKLRLISIGKIEERKKSDVHLALAGGDDGVTGDELGEDSAGGLDTEGQGADIDEDDVSGAFGAGEDTTLDGSTVGDGLIGVDSLGRLLAAEVLLEELLDLGDTSGTTNKDDLKRGE